MKEEKNKWRLEFENEVKARSTEYRKSINEIKQLKDVNEKKDKLDAQQKQEITTLRGLFKKMNV